MKVFKDDFYVSKEKRRKKKKKQINDCWLTTRTEPNSFRTISFPARWPLHHARESTEVVRKTTLLKSVTGMNRSFRYCTWEQENGLPGCKYIFSGM